MPVEEVDPGFVNLERIQEGVNDAFILPNRTSPQDTRVLLDHSEEALKKAWWQYIQTSVDPTTWLPDWTTNTFFLHEQRLNDLGKLYAYYDSVLDEGVPEKVYREVTAPLMLGKCYGPPSCSEAVVETSPVGTDDYGPFVYQVPKFMSPYILIDTLKVFQSGAQRMFEQWLDDTIQAYHDAAKVAVDLAVDDVLKPFLIAAGIVFGIGGLMWISGQPKRGT